MKCPGVVEELAVIRRSPHGERGLKYARYIQQIEPGRRSPHGERGLKFVGVVLMAMNRKSLPSRGAWIEIPPIIPIYGIFPSARN